MFIREATRANRHSDTRYGALDGNGRWLGFDGHNVVECIGAHAQNRRDARARRIEWRSAVCGVLLTEGVCIGLLSALVAIVLLFPLGRALHLGWQGAVSTIAQLCRFEDWDYNVVDDRRALVTRRQFLTRLSRFAPYGARGVGV